MILVIILIITGIVVETLLVGNTLITLRLIDNEKECDKEFWKDSDK